MSFLAAGIFALMCADKHLCVYPENMRYGLLYFICEPPIPKA